MNKNPLLSFTNYLCSFLKTIIVISLITVTIFFIHFQFNPNSYKEWNFKFLEDRPFLYLYTDTTVGKETIDINNLNLADWTKRSLYFNYIKFYLIFILIYASIDEQGEGILSAVSPDGRVKFRLPAKKGEVREPAWSPFY